MELYPAIDLRGGQVVRLHQGDYASETVYGDDPVAVARAYAAAGAGWIHVVDLDAARTGQPLNREIVAAIAAGVTAKVQCGGGVRDDLAAASLLESGVDRVVLGTAALEDPGLVRRLSAAYPGRIAVGLDARAGQVAVRGWVEDSGRSVVKVAQEFDDVGVAAVVVTDIGRDGTLAGPDLDGLAAVLAATELEVIASGGVGTVDHIRSLASLDVDGRTLAGAIVGKALYEDRFTVEEGIAACGR